MVDSLFDKRDSRLSFICIFFSAILTFIVPLKFASKVDPKQINTL